MKTNDGWFYIVDGCGCVLGKGWGEEKATELMNALYNEEEIAKRGISVVGEWDGE